MHEIPNVVWATLFGSGLTLIGVLLSNWHNGRQLRKQLGHDSEEKQKDRITSLRKEVYLNAAEEMSNANNHLARLPQIDPSKESISAALSGFFAASAKLQLVCNSGAAGLANDLTVRFGEILMRLLVKASSIHNLNTAIRIDGDFYERNQAEVERTLMEMRRLSESGNVDQVRFATLQASYDTAQQGARFFAEKRSKAFEQQKVAMREYTFTMFNEVHSVGILQLQLLAALRAELDLETDLAEFESKLEANFERMSNSVKSLLASLENG